MVVTKQSWYQSYKSVKARCNCKTHRDYSRYGGRGIKFLLTYDIIEFLWKRDKAVLMNKPSLDRINNNGSYTLENCQFIEHSINANKDKSWFKKRQKLNKEISRVIGSIYS